MARVARTPSPRDGPRAPRQAGRVRRWFDKHYPPIASLPFKPDRRSK